MRENTDQKNSEYGHFSRNVSDNKMDDYEELKLAIHYFKMFFTDINY